MKLGTGVGEDINYSCRTIRPLTAFYKFEMQSHNSQRTQEHE